ncbi:TetR/AcrR family transcriptional regulator [Nocardiopsis salina]|uniref:TetR/AcrR family transcriptional regulator n=1 Tax=Nocardiopsis salina TaxID=245836 RepID=UPI00034C9122|nr:TetR/AcrR family transcriptional regulator [Nocardiopsis salina]
MRPSTSPGAGREHTPGPRPRLSRELIAETAIGLAEHEGVRALTMRRLATRLSVAPGTLYTYVSGKDDLELLVLDTLVGQQDRLPHTLPGTWREQVEAWAKNDWDGYVRHPWVMELRFRVSGGGPNMIAWLDSALRVFEGTGLSDRQRLDVVETVDGFVRGSAVLHLRSDDAMTGGATAPTPEMRTALGEAPDLVAALTARAAGPTTDRFEFGLRCLLSGVQEVIDAADRP